MMSLVVSWFEGVQDLQYTSVWLWTESHEEIESAFISAPNESVWRCDESAVVHAMRVQECVWIWAASQSCDLTASIFDLFLLCILRLTIDITTLFSLSVFSLPKGKASHAPCGAWFLPAFQQCLIHLLHIWKTLHHLAGRPRCQVMTNGIESAGWFLPYGIHIVHAKRPEHLQLVTSLHTWKFLNTLTGKLPWIFQTPSPGILKLILQNTEMCFDCATYSHWPYHNLLDC